MTLIEILVVLVLLGIVMGIVAGNFIGQGEEAKRKAGRDRDHADRQHARSVQTGDWPLSDHAGGPASADQRRPSGVNNWNGPYWKKGTLPKDPWGNEYKYTAPGAKGPYDIVSYGADAERRRRRSQQGHYQPMKPSRSVVPASARCDVSRRAEARPTSGR